ncbi:putative methylation of MCP proteins-related protein [Halobacteriovorax marinus SJ]|uniref:Methylation of MCP proteins-related protein n=1 Tax=Halobacteriovorax marinus (strain ATCC BAA-682 / DSM 15412 / SJ) TaxID=862908 RepID=E1WYB4_HALMS|nr:chemotaxis protein CheD [Halobacteriovorax marinus]CBW25962.1 putative methylation of MCP proteins-related protein [Halobacteriovorax marinus SJ]
MALKIVHVKIGEVKVARGEELLKATLGSCVGISFFDTKTSRCALAHCLLPTSNGGYGIGAKYVNQAMDSLVALMKVRGREQSDFIVSYAGGANMMNQIAHNRDNEIGYKNLMKLKEILSSYDFKVKELDCGDHCGRQMSILSPTGEVQVMRLDEG